MNLFEEFKDIEFKDKRINKRLENVLNNLLNENCNNFKSWKEMQGSFRFYANEKVTPEKILSVHKQKTLDRIEDEQVVFLINDTSEILPDKQAIKGLGPTNSDQTKGFYIHPTIAITPDRLCLGIENFKYWNRDTIGDKEEENKKNRRVEEKESYKWVETMLRANEYAKRRPQTKFIVMGDRDSDMYEFMHAKKEADYLIRVVQNRQTSDNILMFQAVQKEQPIAKINFKCEQHGYVEQEVRIKRITITPPKKHPQKDELAPVTLTVVHCIQTNNSDKTKKGEKKRIGAEDKPIEWFLVTSLDVKTAEDAINIVNYYLVRWEIELFFKILKSGFNIEKMQFEYFDRLINYMALCSVLAWRIMFVKHLGRVVPHVSCELFFEAFEWQVTYVKLFKTKPPKTPPTLQEMVIWIARLGGYLNRKSDPLPGIKVLWRGMKRLIEACEDYLVFKNINDDMQI